MIKSSSAENSKPSHVYSVTTSTSSSHSEIISHSEMRNYSDNNDSGNMVVEKARVLSRDGNVLWVAADRSSACASCKAKPGCGTSLFAKLGAEQVTVRALVPPNLANEHFTATDWIELAIDRWAFLKVTAILYLLPLLGLMLGVLSVEHLGDIASALGGFAGLLLGGCVASAWLKRYKNDPRLQPMVLRKLSGDLLAEQVLIDPRVC